MPENFFAPEEGMWLTLAEDGQFYDEDGAPLDVDDDVPLLDEDGSETTAGEELEMLENLKPPDADVSRRRHMKG